MIKTDGRPTIAWGTSTPTVDPRDAEIDAALAFGRRLQNVLGAVFEIPTGIPAVSLLDEPTRGCLVVHVSKDEEYLVEFTRLPALTDEL